MKRVREIVAFAVTVTACAACGGDAVPPAKPPVPPAAVTDAAAPVTVAAVAQADAAAPALPPVEPTVLTDEQKKRDEALGKKIGAFVDAYANVHARYTKDRAKVVFQSNRDGQWHVYVSDTAKPAALPKKISSGTERCETPEITPDGKTVLYISDEGADENFRIFKVGIDGANLVNLTPGDKLHRDRPFVPLLTPSVMVYSARDHKSPETKIFTQSVSGAADAKVVYTDPAPGEIVDVSPDGVRALYVRAKSPSDQVLFRLDLDQGKVARLYPPERKVARIFAARYSSDGKRVFVSTDDGAEASYVVELEPRSGIISGRYKEEAPATAEIQEIAVSPKDDHVAITVDAGNHTEVRLLDSKRLSLEKTVKSQLGVAAAGEFSSDGQKLTMVLSAPDKPTDIYEVDAATAAVKPLRSDTRPGLATLPKLDVSIEKVKAFDGLDIPVNVYLPKDRGKAQLPVLTIVHGGPSSSSRVNYSAFVAFWASQGFAVVEPNIRGSTGFGRAYELADNREKRGDALKDLESVNKWTRTQPWCDGDRIVVFGGSYGGYMTLMALTRQQPLWRAGIDLVGPSNLATLLKSTDQRIRTIFVDEFGDVDKDAALLEQFSPLKDVDKITAPLFVYQGQNDPRVLRSESDAVVRTLRAKNIHVEYMVAENEGHSIDRRETRMALMARGARFLADEMKLPPKK